MSYRCIARVLQHSRQTGNAKLLLVAIAEFSNDDGSGATPSIATLACIIGTGERNVQLLLRKLEHADELMCEQGVGPNGCNRYTIFAGDPRFARAAQPDSSMANNDSSAQDEAVCTQRKEGGTEGGISPAPERTVDIPLPPPGEPSLPEAPRALWQATRTAHRPADLYQLEAFANEHDRPTGGAGCYWVGRAILAAAAYDVDFATNPRALNLVRAILTRWRNHAAYGTDTPTYQALRREQPHASIRPQPGRIAATQRAHPQPYAGRTRGGDAASDTTVACTFLGFAADGN